MPIKFKDLNVTSGNYSYVILNDISERLSLRVIPEDFAGSDLVDGNGYLIPGAVLAEDEDGHLVPVTAGSVARGVVLEASQIAESNSATDLGDATELDVVVVVAGTVEQGNAEYNLGREYNANELAAFGENDALILTLEPNAGSGGGEG